jgi:hypothetical protein
MRPVVVRFSVIVALVLGVGVAWALSNGPPLSRTGAFAFGAFAAEPNCTACHSGNALNDPNGLLEILDVPDTYTPGQRYTLRVRLSYALADTTGASDPKWGFELTAVRADSGLRAGTLVLPNPGPAPTYPDSLLLRVPTTAPYNASGRQYIEQTQVSTRLNEPGPVEWHFDWIAPDTSQGTIYFFAAGNAANGNFSTSGDHIFTALDSTTFNGTTDVPMVSRNAGLTLESPLPNPTRGRPATLRFTLARAGHVQLAIFDPLGRRVRTLVAGDHGAGSGQVVWDGRGESGEALAPGTYFARLALGGAGASVQRKITLSR